MACARGVGMQANSLPSAGISPVRLMSTPVTRNAPTAAGQPPSTVPAPTSSAAPGVDQASVTGTFECQESQSTPMPKRGGECQQPGCRLGGAGAHSPEPGKEHSEGRREAHQSRHDARNDWLGEAAGRSGCGAGEDGC